MHIEVYIKKSTNESELLNPIYRNAEGQTDTIVLVKVKRLI